MLGHLDLSKVLFLDVECVSGKANYDELNDDFKYLWKLKSKSVLRKYDEEITEEEADAAYKDRAGIYAEFGKIVCISCGIVQNKPGGMEIRMKSFAGDDEKELLENFAQMLNQHYNAPNHILCGHNAKEFDFPFLVF